MKLLTEVPHFAEGIGSNVIPFPSDHARTSTTSRAAKAVRTSAVTNFCVAVSVAKIAAHQSAGMKSRCHHLETAEAPAPISEAMASRDGHSSITDRKEDNTVMADVIGRLVLKRKAILSLDCKLPLGHNVPMADLDSKAQYEQEFIERVRAARIATGKKQWQVAELMGIKQDQYKHYETGRVIPHHLIGRFCLICSIDPNWLITGKGAKPLQPPHVIENEKPETPSKVTAEVPVKARRMKRRQHSLHRY